MSASELAFLALGLVLGLASGLALFEIFRARPSASREIRVTVAPNAIHARMAATLSDPTDLRGVSAPARGGPGDRRWHDDERRPADRPPARRAEDRPAAVAASVRSTAPDGPSHGRESRTLVPSRMARPDRPGGIWTASRPVRTAVVDGPGRDLVAVPMSREPDPLTAALRATATLTPAAVASADAPRSTDTAPSAASDPPADAVPSASMGTPSTDPGANASPASASPPGEPCADERRIADERCAVAVRAREGAAAAAEELRAAQRAYDEHASAAESWAAAADPRAIRAAKEAAQGRFREARHRAGTHEDVEAAARAWLAEINQINQDTRDAAGRAERSRAEAASLSLTLERLAVAADAARISAERAEEACVAAREAVAACDEARAIEAARPTTGAPPMDDRVAAARPPGPEVPSAVDDHDAGESMASRAGDDALILRILRGDREAMQRAVARLAGDEADAGRRWQAELGGLADALIARAIEASAFDFPTDHFFWGPFSQDQCRDIAGGLSSLGFRFDGFGGWVDERVPSQRDLSLAVGYAGLDPMRIRHWPNEAEMRELLANVRVAADEYVAGAAGSLTLGELVSLLGRRADGLTELWNDWGTVRPILLGAG